MLHSITFHLLLLSCLYRTKKKHASTPARTITVARDHNVLPPEGSAGASVGHVNSVTGLSVCVLVGAAVVGVMVGDAVSPCSDGARVGDADGTSVGCAVMVGEDVDGAGDWVGDVVGEVEGLPVK